MINAIFKIGYGENATTEHLFAKRRKPTLAMWKKRDRSWTDFSPRKLFSWCNW